jgi:Protein of unknown function (DUF3747)
MSSSAVIPCLPCVKLSRLSGASLAVMLAWGSLLAPGSSRAQSLFAATDVEQGRFVLVAAPIGSSGNRFQLNIYEQIIDRRPCFAVTPGVPAPVDPLLASFDFTGICSRYIDANGYSLRIGDSDLATSYRLIVRSDESGTALVATPTKGGAGPELLVARSGGPISGFHKLQPEPGWRLMRRVFGGRRLGHLYVYIDAWPAAAAPLTAPAAQPAATAVPPAAALPGPAGSTAPAGQAPLPTAPGTAAAAPLTAPPAQPAPTAVPPAAALPGPAGSAAPSGQAPLPAATAPTGAVSPIRAGDSKPLPAASKL